MQLTSYGPTERSGEVFLLDILSHRISEIGMFQELRDLSSNQAVLNTGSTVAGYSPSHIRM